MGAMLEKHHNGHVHRRQRLAHLGHAESVAGRSVTKRNETKRNETKRNETKQNGDGHGGLGWAGITGAGRPGPVPVSTHRHPLVAGSFFFLDSILSGTPFLQHRTSRTCTNLLRNFLGIPDS